MKKIKRYFTLLLFIIISFNSQKNTLKTGCVNINDTRIYYEIIGKGEPIVLIHGFAYDNRVRNYQLSHFKDNYELLRYDLRGFGKSALPDIHKKYTHVSDLLSLLDYFNINEAHIVGNSLGGTIAVDFALYYPNRVKSLILAEAGLNAREISMPDEISAWFIKTIEIAQSKGIEQAKKHWLSGILMASALNNTQSCDIAQKMIKDYSGWHWLNDDPIIREIYSLDKLKDINIPVLIIEGDLSHNWFHNLVVIQSKNITNSRVERIMGSGHSLSIEKPEQFNKIVSEFLLKIN